MSIDSDNRDVPPAANEIDAHIATGPGAVNHPPRTSAESNRLLSFPTADGRTVSAHDFGGEGRPLLLAHPMGFHGGVMCALARHLHSVHCYAPDLRGHGHTTAPEDYSFPPSGAAFDILACADGIESKAGGGLIGMGHSLGAAALVLAELERPGTFERLYLYEPAIIPPDGRTKIDSDSPYIRRTLRRRRAFGSLQAAYSNFSSKPPMQDFTADAFVAYIRDGFAAQADGSVLLRCLPEIEAAISMSGISFRAFEGLSEVRCPVVVGRSTLAESPGRAPYETEVVSALPNARLEHVGPLTHFGPQQQPAHVAVRIQSWIAGDAPAHDA